MKGRKKRYIIAVTAVIALLIAAFIGWTYLQLHQQQKQVDVDLYTLVPASSEAIIEVQDLKALHENITHSCLERQHFKTLEVSVLATFILDNLGQLSTIRQDGNSNRLLLSFHQPHTTHDQVIYGMTGSEGTRFIGTLLDHYFPNSGQAKSIKYREEEIRIYPIGRNFLACWIKDGTFVISLQKRLIEKVIDATKDSKHALTESTLATLRKQRKSREPLTLYLHTSDENKWEETAIRMNREAIFLSASNNSSSSNDTSYHEPTFAATTESLNEHLLPGHIQMICQTGFKTKRDETPLGRLLDEQGCRQLTYIMFSPKENKHTRHQILMADIPLTNMDETNVNIRYGIGAKRQPSIWTAERAYPVWQYKNLSKEMMQHFAQPLPDTICYLTLCEDKILIAPMRETLHEYIMETAAKKDADTPPYDHNRKQYFRILEHLAEEASSTFITDMADLMCDTLTFNHADNRLLNPFFIKHQPFFRHFIYARQTIHSNGTTNVNQVMICNEDL